MILRPLSFLDCAVFGLLLVWQLLYQLGLNTTIISGIKVLVRICKLHFREPTRNLCHNTEYANIGAGIPLPIQVVRERYLTPKSLRPQFVRQATLFEYAMVRFIHRAFKALPTSVLRVALDAAVARPFFKWRMLSHGYDNDSVDSEEVSYDEVSGVHTGGYLRRDFNSDQYSRGASRQKEYGSNTTGAKLLTWLSTTYMVRSAVSAYIEFLLIRPRRRLRSRVSSLLHGILPSITQLATRSRFQEPYSVWIGVLARAGQGAPDANQ